MNDTAPPRWAIASFFTLASIAACGNTSSPHAPVETEAGASGAPGGGTSGAGTTSGSGGLLTTSGAGPSAGAGAVAGTRSTAGASGGHDPIAGTSGTPAEASAGDGAGGSVVRGGTSGASGAGASIGGVGGSGAECGPCSAYSTSQRAGSVEPTALEALSGLAMSPKQSEILFAHNDHDRPVVFALDLAGREHARITLEGAPATDIEDIAVGPCGAEKCLFLADIGDNGATRDEYALLRLVVPAVPEAPGTFAITASYQRFRFTYEDGSHNAEGLMVSSDGAVYVVTKLAPGGGGRVAATGPSSVYRLPQVMDEDMVGRATKVATLPVPASGELAASAVAAHPCGESFLLRTYDRVYEFSAPGGMGFEAAFSAAPRVVAMPDEPQSEGIDYLAHGKGFVTAGEGARAPIMQTACAP